MLDPSNDGYDRAITMFSPDGRLFQVEYAIQAVRHGSTVVGIKTKDGISLVAERRMIGKLQIPDTFDRIVTIDTHIGASYSGLKADTTRLFDYARILAQHERLEYDEPISIKSLTSQLCKVMQVYTQHGMARPFGTALMLAGFDEENLRLATTGPSGGSWTWKAVVLGSGEKTGNEFLQKHYSLRDTYSNAVKLGIRTLNRIRDKPLSVEELEIGVLPITTKIFRKYTDSELRDVLADVTQKD